MNYGIYLIMFIGTAIWVMFSILFFILLPFIPANMDTSALLNPIGRWILEHPREAWVCTWPGIAIIPILLKKESDYWK